MSVSGAPAVDWDGTRAGARVAGPLLALIALAALLRLATIDLQSLWYDEAFTPVHVFHASLAATWHGYLHSENTPPLWYALQWPIVRLFGSGAVALRTLSALAGIATVPVAWAIGRELEDSGSDSSLPRAALVCAGVVAVNPLLVWYSQEARAYALFVLAASLAFLCFLRALRDPSARNLCWFALAASLSLLSHYFAVFLLAPMILWLLWRLRSRALVAVALPVAVGVALVPLALAQGGHGTQWIGEWALASRLEAIPQYYLTGYTGSALGHGIELLIALPILAGVLFGLWRGLTAVEERGALLALAVSACGVLLPLLLALGGADYLAPRNLVAAMVPLSALLALVIAARRTGTAGLAIAGLVALGFLALSVDVFLSPRLQRGDWRGIAALLLADRRSSHGPRTAYRGSNGGRPELAIVTAELGAAPLEHYLAPLVNLAPGRRVAVSEVVEIGYAPLRASAERPPARGLRLVARHDVHGLDVYRFVSAGAVTISQFALRESAIAQAPHSEVLVPGKSN
ncbi:MAG TPA: glycosyltransferase family 39 protein [Solirubrobacteraceae bacterium]|nr:glycosyltransferase family 39 protein [Solirubrobacteraceae bacterium]